MRFIEDVSLADGMKAGCAGRQSEDLKEMVARCGEVIAIGVPPVCGLVVGVLIIVEDDEDATRLHPGSERGMELRGGWLLAIVGEE